MTFSGYYIYWDRSRSSHRAPVRSAIENSSPNEHRAGSVSQGLPITSSTVGEPPSKTAALAVVNCPNACSSVSGSGCRQIDSFPGPCS